MNMQLLAEDRQSPSVVLSRLVDEHGVLNILGALLKALLRRDRRAGPPFVEDLSGHLRRDIGLLPRAESARHWDLL